MFLLFYILNKTFRIVLLYAINNNNHYHPFCFDMLWCNVCQTAGNGFILLYLHYRLNCVCSVLLCSDDKDNKCMKDT